MAKRRKQLSVGKILALKPAQLEKLSAKELRRYTTFLNSAANKRVKRAQERGTESEVLRKAIQGGRFKTSRIGKNIPEAEARPIAYAEFMRVREFMKKETSSTRGVKKTQKKIIKKFMQKAKKLGITQEPTPSKDIIISLDPQQLGRQISDQDLNDLVWTQVDKLAENHTLTKEQRYRAAGAAYEIVTQSVKTKEQLYNDLTKWYDDDYISSVEEVQDVGDDEIEALFRGFDL